MSPHTQIHFGGVIVFVINKARTKILLVFEKSRKNPVWKLPGGRIEKNETPEQASIRETWEETGVELDKETVRVLYQEPDLKHGTIKYLCIGTSLHDFEDIIDVGSDYEIPKIINLEDLDASGILWQHREIITAYLASGGSF